MVATATAQDAAVVQKVEASARAAALAVKDAARAEAHLQAAVKEEASVKAVATSVEKNAVSAEKNAEALHLRDVADSEETAVKEEASAKVAAASKVAKDVQKDAASKAATVDSRVVTAVSKVASTKAQEAQNVLTRCRK